MKKIILLFAALWLGALSAQTGADIQNLVQITNSKYIDSNKLLVMDISGNLGYTTIDYFSSTTSTGDITGDDVSITNKSYFRMAPTIQSPYILCFTPDAYLGFRQINSLGINVDTAPNGKLGMQVKNNLRLQAEANNLIANPAYFFVLDKNGVVCKRNFSDISWTAEALVPQTSYISSINDNTVNPAVNFQGIIDNAANNIIFKVYYRNAHGSYTAYSSDPITVVGENGDTKQLIITYPAGSFLEDKMPTSSTIGAEEFQIKAKVQVLGGNSFNVRKILLNAKQHLITFPFKINGVYIGDLNIDVQSIPDKYYGDGIHNFIYKPAELVHFVLNEKLISYFHSLGLPYKRYTFLNFNLGAEYSRYGSPDFNPNHNILQITDPNLSDLYNDTKLRGSLFQYGRDADGHEITRWTGPNSVGLSQLSDTSAPSFTPHTSLFYVGKPGDNPKHWGPAVMETSNNLWFSNGVSQINNPCPAGYRPPAYKELYPVRRLAENLFWNDPDKGLNFISSAPFPNNQIRSEIGLLAATFEYRIYDDRALVDKEHIFPLGRISTGTSVGFQTLGVQVKCIIN